MRKRITIGAVMALAVVFLMPGTTGAQEATCPEGTHAIYTDEGILVSCEEVVGSPESCPDGAVPGYLESGQLAGCFTGVLEVEERCQPVGADGDGDGVDDACDPSPDNPDGDYDGWGDGAELYLGTDPLDACPDNPSDDAWPPDINMDGWVNVLDILLYPARGVLMTHAGDPNYDPRFDLNADSEVNVLDILVMVPHLMTRCTEAVGVVESECWGCMELPIKTVQYHVWGEFRWTIPLPWPIPDLVRVVYRMDLNATFAWVEGFDVAGFGKPTYASAWAVWPYYIWDDPWIQYDQEAPDKVKVEAGTAVYLLPEFSSMAYPIRVWIEFQPPNQTTYGAVNFHYWWEEEG